MYMYAYDFRRPFQGHPAKERNKRSGRETPSIFRSRFVPRMFTTVAEHRKKYPRLWLRNRCITHVYGELVVAGATTMDVDRAAFSVAGLISSVR